MSKGRQRGSKLCFIMLEQCLKKMEQISITSKRTSHNQAHAQTPVCGAEVCWVNPRGAS